jgi:hypothetical protein
MRFFTIDWWRDVQRGSAANPSEAYEAHLASLRPFPMPVARLDQLPSIHDAHVRRVDHLGTAVSITLDSWDEKGSVVQVALSYRGVDSMTLEADRDGLPGPAGFGDLGYCEIDRPSRDVFEHRLLFSSGLELCVRFREFDFSVDATSRPKT